MNSTVIYLIGLSGSGKSTLGKQLAEKINYQFIDLDDAIVQQQGKSINEIFQSQGEIGFRKIEQQLLISTLFLSETIIACGGGTPCYSDNMEFMLKNGTTIYLAVEIKKLCERLKNNIAERPLLKELREEALEAMITDLLATRKAIYEQAHHIIENSETTEIATEKILVALK